MSKLAFEALDVKVVPASTERWNDLESLFGPKGAYAGCWCMFWRMERADFKKHKGDGAKAVLRGMTLNDEVPGVIAYRGNEPIGWCSVGPRSDYYALESSRILKRIDDEPVWSIVCFYVAKPYRSKGVMTQLLRGAMEHAIQKGARIIEAYPIDMQTEKLAGQVLTSYSGFMGIASVFRSAGFKRVASASETQLIMRYVVP